MLLNTDSLCLYTPLANLSGKIIHLPSWVVADNPITCPNSTNKYVSYKNANANNPVDSIVTKNSLNVTVYPNPFDASFNIAVYNVSINSDLELRIENINGNIIYINSGHVPDGSGIYQFTWNAGMASSGLYFYRIRVDGGRSYSGKMVKLQVSL